MRINKISTALGILGLVLLGFSIVGASFRASGASGNTSVASSLVDASITNGATEKPETIILSETNSIVFRGVVTSSKVTEMQIRLMKLSRERSPDDTLYLVLDTPGGSVDAGNSLIDTINSIPQKVKTITVFSASMGFQFVQNFGERLILPNGTLMSHRAYFSGVEGEVPGELLVRLNFSIRDLNRLDGIAAHRMGIGVEKYQELIRDEYWVKGADAVKDKAADRVVLARCDGTLDGQTKELIGMFFGMEVYGIMSKCPVISGILGVEVGGREEASQEQRQRAYQAGLLYAQNRTYFVRKYISRTKNQ